MKRLGDIYLCVTASHFAEWHSEGGPCGGGHWADIGGLIAVNSVMHARP